MVLAIDIGNTNISLGVFKGRYLLRRFSIPTDSKSYYPRLKEFIHSRPQNRGFQATDGAWPLSISLQETAGFSPRSFISGGTIHQALICSVVPKAARRLEKDLKRILRNRPYVIGRDIKVPIKNLYRRPGQVGQDRLINAYAAVMFYGAPIIAVDFGTAITFDVISKNKEYLGGMILPGLRISLEALAERTALLPKVKLAAPSGFIGRDTKGSILSGIIYGFCALTDEMIVKIRREIGKKTPAIGTGGDIALIGKYCRNFHRIERDLTLKGINLLASASPV